MRYRWRSISCFQDKSAVGRNPFALTDQPLLRLPLSVEKQLFKGKAFIKKIVEDNVAHEDTKNLLLYLCFENSRFSAELLTELLWQVSRRRRERGEGREREVRRGEEGR